MKRAFKNMSRFKLCAFVWVFMIALVRPNVAFVQEDPVVVIVNGIKIVRSEIDEARLRLPERLRNAPLQSVYEMLVNSLVDTKLVAAEAREINLQNDQEVLQQMSRIEDQVLERVFLSSYIQERVTENALANHYKKLVEANKSKEEVRARHILVETEAQAREIIAELDEGADFAELAKTKSKGPSAPKGGDLDFFAEGQMVPSFSKAAFALKKGEITPSPVQTQFGWHIIKVEDRRPLQPLDRSEIEEQLRVSLSRDIGSAYLLELRKKANIKRFNIDGTPIANVNSAQ